jgi:hypothetical protein
MATVVSYDNFPENKNIEKKIIDDNNNNNNQAVGLPAAAVDDVEQTGGGGGVNNSNNSNTDDVVVENNNTASSTSSVNIFNRKKPYFKIYDDEIDHQDDYCSSVESDSDVSTASFESGY